MSSNFKNSAAILAALAMLGSGAATLAQTGSNAPAAPGQTAEPAAPGAVPQTGAAGAGAGATEAPAAGAATGAGTEAPVTGAPATGATGTAADVDAGDPALPALLRGPAFASVETEPARRGDMTMIRATLTDGTELRGVLDADGNLAGLRAPQGTSLPPEVIAELLPEALRAHPVLAEIAVISALGTRDGAVMIAGQDANGNEVRAGFDADGALMRFGRHDAERGPRGHGAMQAERGNRGERGEHRRHRTERNQGAETRPELDEAAIRRTLEGAGYTEIDDIERTRRGVRVEAVNPNGDEVEVILNRHGEIVRERRDD